MRLRPLSQCRWSGRIEGPARVSVRGCSSGRASDAILASIPDGTKIRRGPFEATSTPSGDAGNADAQIVNFVLAPDVWASSE